MTEDKFVRSPCISVCDLNRDDVCEGCWRTIDEIAKWGIYSNDEKRDVIEKCKQRRLDSGFYL